jgi:hypothetical protein
VSGLAEAFVERDEDLSVGLLLAPDQRGRQHRFTVVRQELRQRFAGNNSGTRAEPSQNIRPVFSAVA